MTLDEAIRNIRSDPKYAALVADAYLGSDIMESAKRFHASAEFKEVEKLLPDRIPRARIVDLGAGTGIASWAFATTGAERVYAVEPDRSNEVGQGAIRRLTGVLPIELIPTSGEDIPLGDGEIDIVYSRQVFHHVEELPRVFKECARILKKGGLLLASREHVVDNKRQLEAFLKHHPIHQLASGENAYPLSTYIQAITSAGFRIHRVLGPWDSIINAFPTVRSADALHSFVQDTVKRRLGPAGSIAWQVPWLRRLFGAWIRRPFPGRLYTFLASKP